MLSGLSPIHSRISFPRAAALGALLACRLADKVLDEEVEKNATVFMLDTRDRALAMELAYGVLRRQETIDWWLASVLKKPLSRLPAVIQILLRLGAYQLLFMNRIPTSAAVNESVRLAKSNCKKLQRDWSGFVNAVLRNLARLPEPVFPDFATQPDQALSVRYSIPSWLCRRWIEQVGPEQAESTCHAASSIPTVTLRVNQRRLTREAYLDRLRQEGIMARPTMISPVGVVLEKGQLVTSLPGFNEGDFYVEDEAAQLIPPLLNPQPGDFVLDACAAPGGKTTHLAELMDNRGRIVAMDRQGIRLDLLRLNCQRLGSTIVTEVIADAKNPTDILRAIDKDRSYNSISNRMTEGLFDRVLVDAPCSGLGVLRRHPEAKWHKQFTNLYRHHEQQKQILEGVASVLRPGGVLVYSTCSTEPEETEEVVAQFCCAHADWMRESVASWLPSAALAYVTAHGALSTMGNTCGMDGFYAARLRKVS